MLDSTILANFVTPKTCLGISNPHAMENKINSTIYGLALPFQSTLLNLPVELPELRKHTLVQYVNNIIFFPCFLVIAVSSYSDLDSSMIVLQLSPIKFKRVTNVFALQF